MTEQLNLMNPEPTMIGSTTETKPSETESSSPTTDPAAFIVEAMDRAKGKKIKKSPVSTNRASALGHPCLRYLVMLRLYWDQETLHDVGLQYIFDEGNHQEKALLKDLAEADIEIIQGQVGLQWREYQITGHIDGVIRWERNLLPVEIKSVNPNWWAKIDSFEDIKNHKSWIVRKWAAQMTLYLAMHNQEHGLMILKNKSTGRIKVLNVALDYEIGEKLIKKAEEINRCVESVTIPDPIEWGDVCERCGFFPHLCTPDIVREGAEIMDDEELEADLERWDELKAVAKEYDELDKSIKGRVKHRHGFCGEWEIGGTLVQVRGNPNPKPKEPSEYWKSKIRKMTT